MLKKKFFEATCSTKTRKKCRLTFAEHTQWVILTFLSYGFLTTWFHHLGSIWFDTVTQGFINCVYRTLSNKCKDRTARFIKAWSTTITMYCLVSAKIS